MQIYFNIPVHVRYTVDIHIITLELRRPIQSSHQNTRPTETVTVISKYLHSILLLRISLHHLPGTKLYCLCNDHDLISLLQNLR